MSVSPHVFHEEKQAMELVDLASPPLIRYSDIPKDLKKKKKHTNKQHEQFHCKEI